MQSDTVLASSRQESLGLALAILVGMLHRLGSGEQGLPRMRGCREHYIPAFYFLLKNHSGWLDYRGLFTKVRGHGECVILSFKNDTLQTLQICLG